MSYAAAILLSLFGLGIVIAAFNARRLIAWENRVLGALADAAREHRLSLEEDARLLENAQRLPLVPPAPRASAVEDIEAA